MNENRPPSRHAALDESAAEWIFEREGGFTPEREREFADWCAADPERAEAVKRIERTLALLDELPAVSERLEARLAPEAVLPTRENGSVVQLFSRYAWLGGLAAILAVGLVVWWGTASRSSPPVAYAADANAQRTLSLPDGSVIDINVGGDVAVEFTTRERRLVLRKGEAHFQVAHNPARPFIVTAGGVTVRAVGTAFDVRLAGEAVNVLVVEGKVQLGRAPSGDHASEATPPPLLHSGERALLRPGEGELVGRIEKVDAATVSTLLNWQNPRASFTDVPLRDVLARFNRRNSTQLVLEDRELGDRKIGGMIALDQVEAFVRLLEQDGDIVARRELPARIVLRRAR